jgi:hypothetical protein
MKRITTSEDLCEKIKMLQSVDIPTQKLARLVTEGAPKYGWEEQWCVFGYRQRREEYQ